VLGTRTVDSVASQTARRFLVESYVPRLDARTAETLSSRLRQTVRQLNGEGTAVRWWGSFALVDEETYICIIAALKIDDVIEVSERAGLERDHVVEVLAIDAPAGPDD
jgi:hypothetical protein